MATYTLPRLHEHTMLDAARLSRPGADDEVAARSNRIAGDTTASDAHLPPDYLISTLIGTTLAACYKWLSSKKWQKDRAYPVKMAAPRIKSAVSTTEYTSGSAGSNGTVGPAAVDCHARPARRSASE